MGAVVELLLVAVALWVQFRTRRYVAAAYWFLALAIAIFGTGASDTLHIVVGISYAGTTALWAVVLAVIFWRWHRREGTLSIHSITTRRREVYYWATVFATFALGTALGDFTATALNHPAGRRRGPAGSPPQDKDAGQPGRPGTRDSRPPVVTAAVHASIPDVSCVDTG